MTVIQAEDLSGLIARLFIEANRFLPAGMAAALRAAAGWERSPAAREILRTLSDNAETAAETGLPICQDTGVCVVFLDWGQDCLLVGGALEAAVDDGVRRGCRDGYLRASMVRDPVFDRENTGDGAPGVVHLRMVPGSAVRATVVPKGFGSENMTVLRMLPPSAGPEEITETAVEAVLRAGANACPPVCVGVGLGGVAETALLASKRALLRLPGESHPDPRCRDLENEILRRVNARGTGPQGFGGDTTALSAAIETLPTHIAGLPCAVAVGCHAARQASGALTGRDSLL